MYGNKLHIPFYEDVSLSYGFHFDALAAIHHVSERVPAQ